MSLNDTRHENALDAHNAGTVDMRTATDRRLLESPSTTGGSKR